MPHPYQLAFAAEISHSELRRFLIVSGGHRDHGRIYDGDYWVPGSRVRVAWETDRQLAAWASVDEYLDTERGRNDKARALAIQEQITAKLGAAPRTFILLDVFKDPGSERIAMEVIPKFADRWAPCVLNNFLLEPESGQTIWGFEELVKFFRQHGHLPR